MHLGNLLLILAIARYLGIYILIFLCTVYVCSWKKLRRVNLSLHKQQSNTNSNDGTCLQDGENKTTVPVYSEIFTELKVMQNSQT